MKFIYGVSSAIAQNYSNSALETIEFAGKNEFDVVELYCEAPDLIPKYAESEYIYRLRNVSKQYNLSLQMHAPFHSVNLASFNEKAREVSIELIKDTIIMGQALEAKLVTFHLGLCFLPCQINFENAIEILVASLNELLDFASENGIVLAMENRGGKLDIGKPEELLMIYKYIKSPHLKITFDVVQANVLGDPIEHYEILKKHVVNVHIRDAPKGKDRLLAVGEGEIDFKTLVKKFVENHFSGPLIFEVSTKDRALLSRGALDEYLAEITETDTM